MTFERYEVLSGELRRRRWPRALKEEVVLETLGEGVSVTEVARRRGIDRSLIYRWRRELKVSRRGECAGFLPVHVSEAGVPQPAGAEGRPADEGASPPTDSGRRGRMEIALGRGRRLTVFADVDTAALARVLGVLEGR